MKHMMMNNEINDKELETVNGGYYVGSDRYTKEEYARVGITWEHNFWSKDKYWLNGKQITQHQGEWYTMLHLNPYTVQDDKNGQLIGR